MAKAYTRAIKAIASPVPQTQPIPGEGMIANNAGGYGFQTDVWTQLDRFLILGSSGGTYYVSEKSLTLKNADAVIKALKADGLRAVRQIVEISVAGRAPKQSPAIFALALALTHGSNDTKQAVVNAVPLVCRTGSTYFEFLSYLHGGGKVKGLRGKGRAAARAAKAWYAQFDPPTVLAEARSEDAPTASAAAASKFAYQAVKYRERNGWNHRDVLRMRHVKFNNPEAQAVAHYAVKGWGEVGEEVHPESYLRQIWAFERAKLIGNAMAGRVIPVEAVRDNTEAELVKLITDHNLTREMVPNGFLKSPVVWDALLQRMPITAMVRNLANMTKCGLLAPHSDATRLVVSRLGDLERLKKGRVHPMNLLVALRTYAGETPTSAWDKKTKEYRPVQDVVDALDGAFYLAFDAIVPSNKRHMVAIDVSGSMSSPAPGLPSLLCCEIAAATGLIIKRTEPDSSLWRFNTGLDTFSISPRMRLNDVLKHTRDVNGGGTNCALPMDYSLKNGLKFDTFVVITDNETWAGREHVHVVLNKYRQQTGIPAKLVVIAITANDVTIGDPKDPGTLNIAGYDLTVPTVLSDFSRGTSVANVIEDEDA